MKFLGPEGQDKTMAKFILWEGSNLDQEVSVFLLTFCDYIKCPEGSSMERKGKLRLGFGGYHLYWVDQL